jgi:phage repressor protein C with HTH and peptisase S24 domain
MLSATKDCPVAVNGKRYAFHDAHAFVLEIAGSSMEPAYRAGDRLVVSPAEKPRHGDRVAVRTDKARILIGRLGRKSAHGIELVALDSDASVIKLARREVEWIYRIVWASQ